MLLLEDRSNYSETSQAFLAHDKLIMYGSMHNVAIFALLAHANNGGMKTGMTFR